jgi:hypothetical protein
MVEATGLRCCSITDALVLAAQKPAVAKSLNGKASL